MNQKSYGFSECEVLNSDSFPCFISTLISQIRFTNFPHWSSFLHVSYQSDICCNPNILQMYLPSHSVGSLSRENDWEGCVTTGTPEIPRPVQDHGPPAVITEPHNILPPPFLTQGVLQAISTPKESVVRFNPLQVSLDPKTLKARLPVKR